MHSNTKLVRKEQRLTIYWYDSSLVLTFLLNKLAFTHP